MKAVRINAAMRHPTDKPAIAEVLIPEEVVTGEEGGACDVAVGREEEAGIGVTLGVTGVGMMALMSGELIRQVELS
jgi:hypothetical protein